MAIRVSQRSKFTQFVTDMNLSLAKLMDYNKQASSQKKVNRPSDDPVGASRILNYRDSLAGIGQYRENIGEAKDWLSLQDATLQSTNTTLIRIKELAEQAATGTLSADNREQIGYEVRELLEQLVVLGNTEHEGRSVFGGHKSSGEAFIQDLWMTSLDPNLSNAAFSIEGSTETTMMVQFLDTGTVGTTADLNYRYSSDGGDTWTTSQLAGTSNELDMGGVRLTLANGTAVTAVDPDDIHEKDNGSWMFIHPTARYMGDDSDAVEVDSFGSNLNTSTSGTFEEDVIVRIDSDTTLASSISYSYSTDGGLTWNTGNEASSPAASSASLLVPGGFLDLSSNAGDNTLTAGEQFIIRPRKAEHRIEISPGETVTVNAVGKDVFGGIYQDPSASGAAPALNGTSENVLHTVGRLVGYIETNNQDGIQRALEDLDGASGHVMNQLARVGGRVNRLTAADNVLSGMQIDQRESMSDIEDVDIAELMTKLAQQQLVYETVLKSSSMIMRLNLTNFV